MAVLALAAANLGLRLGGEMVDVWDESLYANSALEMVRCGDWLVTTFLGQPDYYNSKPPLNVWLIALLFKLIGPGLWTLRAWSVASAFATIAVVRAWTRRLADDATANLAALVLATTYAFLYVHAGRTGNADAMLTLVVSLTAIATWRAHDHPGTAMWIGPLAATAFMLKGPGAGAFVLPIVIADAVWRVRWSWAERAWWGALAAGVGLAAVPVAVWAVARWLVDGWALFDHMLNYDIGARVAAPIEGHDEPWWFYGSVLSRYWYDWLAALALVAGLAPAAVRRLWARWMARPSHEHWIAGGWLVATVIVPTVVPTRLAWYLNPFYPGAALVGALLIREAWTSLRAEGAQARAWLVAILAVAAALTAEGRIAFRSQRLDVGNSAQGLLLAQREAIAGHRVFAAFCPYPEVFLASAAGSACVAVHDVDAFIAASAPGDFWLDRHDATPEGLTRVDANRRASLHRRP
ncbi:MAG: glycosyltransferase family 39 protein [Vicinamibacterales bacterium]